MMPVTGAWLSRRDSTRGQATALAERISGRVLLALVIDEQGSVSEASVVEGLCAACDEAALAAAHGLVFRPAQRDGVPVSARIRFAYELLPPPPENTPPAALPAIEPALVEPPPAAAPAAAVDIQVQGESKADRLRHSAQAVEVIGLKDAQQRSADLAEVLARSRGVTVQRGGALGSQTRLSLNGFEGDQIRTFLAGVPLDYAGFSLGIANVPVNLVERVEVYRGVVPARFGADALGGAINLVTQEICLVLRLHFPIRAAHSTHTG